MRIAIFTQSETCQPCKDLVRELNKRFADKWKAVVEYYDLQSGNDTEMMSAMRTASQAKVKRVPEILIQHDKELLRLQDGAFDLKEFYSIVQDLIEGVTDPKIRKVDFTDKSAAQVNNFLHTNSTDKLTSNTTFLQRIKKFFSWKSQ